MIKIAVTSDTLEFYSPYTDQPLLKDGVLNTDDPSLKYVYFSELGEFEYNRLGRSRLFDPEEGCNAIDLLVELSDGIPGSRIYVGYADNKGNKQEVVCKSMS